MNFRFLFAGLALLVLLLCGAVALSPPPGMVLVPGADYQRGRSYDNPDVDYAYYPNTLRDDQPVRTVHVDPVYMDETEVTNEHYAAFVKATKHRAPYQWIKGELPAGKGKVPVVNVSWDDAVAFCAWDGGKRLPTEAEWEHACRSPAEGQMYPWGNKTPTAKDAVFGVQEPSAVCGERNRNAFGLCDMIGNVWEWNSDWYEQKYYEIAPVNNPKGPSEGQYHILRGGSWFDQADTLLFLTCSYRSWARASERSGTIGFRCAKSAPLP